MNGETEELAPTLSQTQFLRLALDALAIRWARWVVMVMSFTLFGASCWWPDWKRLATAGAFTVMMALPVWLRKDR